jgi:probable poly-beta-1,6-N-acetyl-D-glucosamine export protein
MYRRISLLPGIAILTVIVNHAMGWGNVALFTWTQRYLPVTVPNFDQYGSLSYYFTRALQQATVFAVPAFLFVSGFFISYAARGSSKLGWKPIRARIVNLLIPYTIWSIVQFILDAITGQRYSPGEYLLRYLLLGANGGFYFIPSLITLYLLSPWLVEWAKKHWRSLLLVSAVMMVIPIIFRYMRLFGSTFPYLETFINWTPDQLFFRWAIYFPLGIVGGMYIDRFKEFLSHHRVAILAATIIFYFVTLVESEYIFLHSPDHWRPGPSSIFSHIFSVFIILAFLAYENIQIPNPKFMLKVGNRSYGIYLVHFMFMTVIAKVIYHVVPLLLSWTVAFEAVMFISALGWAWLLLEFVTRTPLKKYYSYLFG